MPHLLHNNAHGPLPANLQEASPTQGQIQRITTKSFKLLSSIQNFRRYVKHLKPSGHPMYFTNILLCYSKHILVVAISFMIQNELTHGQNFSLICTFILFSVLTKFLTTLKVGKSSQEGLTEVQYSVKMLLDTYALPASIKRSAITAFWHVNSPNRGILFT